MTLMDTTSSRASGRRPYPAADLVALMVLAWGCGSVTEVESDAATSEEPADAAGDAETDSGGVGDPDAGQRGSTGVLIFGGTGDGFTGSGDTWIWDGEGWSEANASGPAGRFAPAATFDAARERVVLFGGDDDDGTGLFGDTWEWDGESWTDVTPADDSPSRRVSHALSYDAGRERVVLFGGSGPGLEKLDDTWEWDGESWEQVASGGPAARDNHAMTYDAARERIVLVGGAGGDSDDFGVFQETWTWDGETWELVAESGPQVAGHDVAYAPARERVVVFGGQDDDAPHLATTWEWDGEEWSDVTPSLAPEPRRLHGLAYDAAGGQIIVFGGFNADSGNFRETLAWTGAAWEDLAPPLPRPSNRRSHAFSEAPLPSP